ncbi:MAG TPA: hypothetical protein VLD65_05415, partial [Anaerolineales bacterium]|nr:hypothetical protein [Anaerolineales bacterium]
CIFRDPVNSLEYIRNNKEMHDRGLYIELEAYKCQVFTSFREVQDNEWHQYANLSAYLNGRGVPSIDETMKEIFLQPIHQAYRELVNAGYFRWVISNRMLRPIEGEEKVGIPGDFEKVLEEAEIKLARLLEEVEHTTQSSGEIQPIVHLLKQNLQCSLFLPVFQDQYPVPRSRSYQQLTKYLHAGNLKSSPWLCGDTYAWSVILGWLFTSILGKCGSEKGYEEISRSWIDEWMLNKIIVSALNDLGLDERSNWRAITLIKLLTTHHDWWVQLDTGNDKAGEGAEYMLLTALLADSDALSYLGVNRYQDVLWFNKEAFEDLVWWLMIIACVEISSNLTTTGQHALIGKSTLPYFKVLTRLLSSAKASGYKLEKLLELVK